MANKVIVPYGFDPSKKPDALALTIVPRLLLKDKQRQPDAPPPIKVMKEINLLPPRANEVLTGVKTNKFGDVTCAKYKSVTPRTTIDGV